MTDSQNEAKRYALKLLGYRGRSEAELTERLSRKGFSDDVISVTLRALTQSGFLNDRILGTELKRQLVEGKLFGHERVKQYMARRGLTREIIRSVADYDEEREIRNAQKLLDKKFGSVRNYLSEKEKRKVWGYLARRGYSFGIIKKVMRDAKLCDEEERDEEHGGNTEAE